MITKFPHNANTIVFVMSTLLLLHLMCIVYLVWNSLSNSWVLTYLELYETS